MNYVRGNCGKRGIITAVLNKNLLNKQIKTFDPSLGTAAFYIQLLALKLFTVCV